LTPFLPSRSSSKARPITLSSSPQRCLPEGASNRGVEAARAAVRMLTMLDEVGEDPDLK
jgi:hypothetical protein